MKSDTKTKVCYSELNDKGEKKQYITSEQAWNKILAKAAEAKEAAPDLVATGTFGYNFAETVDEAVSLSGGVVKTQGEYENTDVFLGVFNYAAGLRQDNEANDILQDTNFAPWEGIKDVSYAIAQKQERAKMSPTERALRELNKQPGQSPVTMDELMAALQLIKQQSAASASA